jgi:hypothetical protein
MFAEGTVISNQGTVFLIRNGHRCPFTNSETLEALRLRGSIIPASDAEIGPIPFGPVVQYPTREGQLISNQGTVFLIRNGQRCPFTSPDTLAALGLQGQPIQALGDAAIATIPFGPVVQYPNREGQLISNQGTVFLIRNGQRCPFADPATLAAVGLSGRPIQLVDDAAIGTIPFGAVVQYPARDGDLISNQGTAFIIRNGQRCPIPNSETFDGLGLNWAAVREVSDASIQSIPIGPAVHGALKFTQTDDFGSFHMITSLRVSENGRVDCVTETHNHVAALGNCGKVAVWFLDNSGNVISQFGGQQYCVGPTIVPFGGASVRTDIWGTTVDPAIQPQIKKIAILHASGGVNPLDRIEANTSRLAGITKDVAPIFEAAARVAAASSGGGSGGSGAGPVVDGA